MSNALILGELQPDGTRLPYFNTHIPAGFPSPALDHMEHKLSLDEVLDLNARTPTWSK
jgi:DNA polymerase V